MSRRLLLIAIASCCVIGITCLWWMCRFDPAVRFFPRWSEAEWIVYPKPPDADPHNIANTSAEFRRVFVAAEQPSEATLRLTAFRTYGVCVNGVFLPPQTDKTNWKRPSTISLKGLLQKGTNWISVMVQADDGPPALCLELTGESLLLKSDETWVVSWAGAVWQPARAAFRSRFIDHGNRLDSIENPWQSVRGLWLILVVGTLLIGGGIILWSQFSPAIVGHLSVRWQRAPSLCLLIAVLIPSTALLLHNLWILSPSMGFDATNHIEYIQYILSHKGLPLPTDGAAMYHPPLYYVLGALLLGVSHLSPVDPGGIIALRLYGLVIWLAQVILIWFGLRRLFPSNPACQTVGTVLAVFIPPQLYLGCNITNELLCATLTTASCYLCLRLNQRDRPTPAAYLCVGACLGAALLTKVTAVIAVPFVLAGVATAALRQFPTARAAAIGRILLATAACGLIAVIHYGRIWWHFGKPLVGNWDPISGFSWWQEDGYRTADYFLRGGEVLRRPLFSGFNSFGDGLYSTLWGDGLYAGRNATSVRPPWNYSWMSAGFLLALGPSLLIVTGIIVALWRLLRKPQSVWLLLVGFIGLGLFALIYEALNVPSYAEVKAFYLLPALFPLCALAALGWDVLVGQRRIMTVLLGTWLGIWAFTSLGTYWVRRDSPNGQMALGRKFQETSHSPEALKCFQMAVQLDETNLSARHALAVALKTQGRLDDAFQLALLTLHDFPQDAISCADAADICLDRRNLPDAVSYARQAVQFAPDNLRGHQILTKALAKSRLTDQAIQSAREGLRVSPIDAELHLWLGIMQASQLDAATNNDGEAFEARMHLRLASRLADRRPTIVASAAWVLATAPDPRVRDGDEAVDAALRANQGRHVPFILAAALAEAGHLPEALAAAREDQSRIAPGQKVLKELCEHLIQHFSAGEPFREPVQIP